MQSKLSNDSSTLREAMAASARHDAERAIELLLQACDEAPGAAAPRLLLGAEYAQTGRLADAEGAFAHAVLLDPGLHIARFQLGLLLFTAGRAGTALVVWQPLLALDGPADLQRFVEGFAALARDDLALARQRLQEGLALLVDNPPLAADMRKVIARIDEVLTPEPAPASTAAASSDGAGEPTSAHVLLSNYGATGPRH